MEPPSNSISVAAAAPKFAFSDPAAPADPRLRQIHSLVGKAALGNGGESSGLKAQTFAFEAPSVGIERSLAAGEVPAAGAGESAPSYKKSPAPVHDEVVKAAAVPLPDDDDEDGDVAPQAGAEPAPAQLVAGGARRVAFAEPEVPKDKNADKTHEQPAKVPPPSPMGASFTADAGNTPFRPPGGQVPPETPSATPAPQVRS
ncbi:hypothetical protein GPECTOR_4g1002 [Gonium pectorale]|uniref:Uncharacterized protein n=1 Tax=Gonium pectorale TaxID=33097 RepID=A0A150GX60_GONPE|nr:hypothetical protein GPECTOR_4g1002 [Gonium pectorale]|eukprot:KXZ54451.1 hypothetical protein GPECTOR_4g1002 [Gonium pectorale]